MRTCIIASAVFAASLACTPLAFAATGTPASSSAPASSTSTPMHAHRGHHRGGMGALDQLDLSNAQRTSIRQAMHQSFEAARPAMQTLRAKRVAFENATPGSADYQSAANTLAQAESDAARARVQRQAELRTTIYNQLTPTQRDKFASLRQQREARAKEWHSKRMHKRANSAPASASSTD